MYLRSIRLVPSGDLYAHEAACRSKLHKCAICINAHSLPYDDLKEHYEQLFQSHSHEVLTDLILQQSGCSPHYEVVYDA
jgi:hypothetical protein